MFASVDLIHRALPVISEAFILMRKYYHCVLVFSQHFFIPANEVIQNHPGRWWVGGSLGRSRVCPHFAPKFIPNSMICLVCVQCKLLHLCMMNVGALFCCQLVRDLDRTHFSQFDITPEVTLCLEVEDYFRNEDVMRNEVSTGR